MSTPRHPVAALNAWFRLSNPRFSDTGAADWHIYPVHDAFMLTSTRGRTKRAYLVRGQAVLSFSAAEADLDAVYVRLLDAAGR